MSTAYIILCHNNPEQVNDLIAQLNNNYVDFYVHIDKKTTDFNISSAENIFVLPDELRVDIKWGTKSMIDATLNSIIYLFNSNKKYDYIFLISGQDYPIKSNKQIQEFLDKNRGANFIEVIDHSSKEYKRYRKRTELFYPKYIMKNTFVSKALKKIYIYATGGPYKTFSIVKRKNPEGVVFEFGSQWWCLNYECLKWILEYIKNHKEILNFFSNTLVPDECFFQTIFMLSPYKTTRQNNLTYIDWEKNKNHPRILRFDDYGTLIKLPFFFARKFNINVDRDIIEKIKNTIQK